MVQLSFKKPLVACINYYRWVDGMGSMGAWPKVQRVAKETRGIYELD